ncbi:sugar porter family MFS transporter [Apibacter sp. B3889]|uniref:sugar porter family MFS transporter n=1 Tax=unclassified Apibacter TaxID=2630820 RepID=UPI00132A0BCF|nr:MULTISPECIES: sugar porter family MFS transporter [unclassified Apibacter]MXO35119.1 sugar porter family MFS transporter [Apibacter sp. B3883]MXO42477.1 sugar porter family MFS transporter [Apibacter sp. B3889]MXP04494.1 sugar porter family MFS transporter [Apibacter sp. B3887]MXP08325.1 sugar porter family MFS transporter [Apibacter sp. B3935]
MNTKYLYWITFVAVNGGLLFGLNMAGIAGANDLIKQDFSLSDSGLGTVASFLMIGCLIGAFFTGSIAEKYGRKNVMIITAIIYIISSLGCAFATSFIGLTIFRVLSGFAVGATSVVGPMYISEISPANKRGTLVSFNQFAITIGIFLAYVFDYFLINLGQESWRYMLGVPALFGIIFLLYLVFSFPESPRWLLAKGKKDEAVEILNKIGGESYVKNELPEMEKSINAEKNKEKASSKELFNGKTGKIVAIGTLIAAFQQITGINAVLIFAPDIFRSAGVGGDTALLQSMIVGIVNVLMTIVALKLVDSKGRKTLLLWGAFGMAVSLGYLTYAFLQPEKNSMGVLIALLGYISFFAASFAPVMWVIISEIYPNRIKGLAMSFSTAVSWGCTFLTVYFAPIIRANLGDSALFGIFGIFTVIAFIFVKFWIPETKGKSLEQIEKELGLID